MAVARIPISITGYKCAMCISEYIAKRQEHDKLLDKTIEDPPDFNEMVDDAVTLAPCWQQHTAFGQVMFACITLPACMKHLGNNEKSLVQRASEAGLAIPGQVVP